MNTDSTQKHNRRTFGTKYRLAAIVVTPLLVAAFLSIVSLRAEIFSRPKNFRFQHVLNKISNLFDRHPLHTCGWDSVRSKMAPIETAIDAYLLNTYEYPKTLNDLVVDPKITGWAGPYLKASQLNDPYGNPFVYILNNQSQPNSYIVKSYGRDGKPGGEGYDADIIND